MIYYKYLITTNESLFKTKSEKEEEKYKVNDIINEFNSNLEEENLSIYVINIEKTRITLSLSSSLNSEKDIETNTFAIQKFAHQKIAELPTATKRLVNPDRYPVFLTKNLADLQQKLISEYRNI